MFEIIGIERLDYVSKKNGQRVRGTNLYCIDGSENRNTIGNRCEKLYCKEAVDTSDFAIGDRIEVSYNRWGNIETAALVESAAG